MPGEKAPEEYRRKDILRAAYDVAARHGVEALTVRAVAARAGVSHGTVLFHFSRRDALVTSLLDSVLDATTVLRIPEELERLARPTDRMRLLLRTEMERLSGDPRQFRLFLEYWAMGVRSAVIRRRVSEALERYRSAFRDIGQAIAHDGATPERLGSSARKDVAPEAQDKDVAPEAQDDVAAVAVSLIHGCALQALIDPKGFSVQQHFDTAARMLEGFRSDNGDKAPKPRHRAVLLAARKQEQ